ncbi:MAG: hypothetical protein ACI8YD_002218, partial [Rheinheimera aquimaris]
TSKNWVKAPNKAIKTRTQNSWLVLLRRQV